MSDHDAMSAEFGTVAGWTAQAARELGPEHHVPGACRGSGGPAAMDWLLEQLITAPGTPLLDVGAGIGGPAGFASARRAARPALVEPEFAACRAARLLFDFDTLCADAAALPLRTASFPAVWSLGVLCTTPDHPAVLRELRRVLQPDGVLGLVVYTVERPPDHQPEGNNFPLRGDLDALLASAGLEVTDRRQLDDLPPAPAEWGARESAVRQRAEHAHGHEPSWQEAARQQRELGELLRSGQVAGEALLARRASDGRRTGA